MVDGLMENVKAAALRNLDWSVHVHAHTQYPPCIPLIYLLLMYRSLMLSLRLQVCLDHYVRSCCACACALYLYSCCCAVYSCLYCTLQPIVIDEAYVLGHSAWFFRRRRPVANFGHMEFCH